MATDVKVQVAGLHTSNNPFSSAAPGAMARADNCVINATNVLEPRRGLEAMGYTFGGSSDRANVLTWYGSTLLVQYASKLCRDTGAAFTDYTGTFSPVASTVERIRFVTAAGNLYFNCSDGLRVLDSTTGTPAAAGVPRALRTYATPASNNGWQTPNTLVAYRSVWGIVDANGNEKLGVPTGRYIGTNAVPVPIGSMSRAGAVVTVLPNTLVPQGLNVGDTFTLTPGEANFAAGLKTITSVSLFLNQFTYAEAGAAVFNTVAQDFQRTRSQTVNAHMPAGITTSHFFRLYRSEMSANASTTPSDELYLCYEGKPTAGEITAGVVSVNDICPEEFLGDPAPWNANDGYGLVQANERPPVSLDLAYWDNCLWYANTTQRHRFFLNVLGIGTPQGIQNGDSITIAGVTYPLSTTPAAYPTVTIETAYTAAENIEATARSLVDSINSYTGSTLVRAYYVSAEDDPPGRILIEEIAIGGSAFTVSASRASSWTPALTRSSDNNARGNGLMFSKPGEPEAVPVVNEVLVGSQNDRILRVIPLKASLIVFKEYEGIWSVTGSNGRYTAERIGLARLLSPETVQTLSDKAWAFTDQGVVTVTEGAGIGVVSYNIETDLTHLFGPDTFSLLKRYSFAVAYESDRRYVAWLPSAFGDTYGTQAYNHSTGTKTWTRWTKAATCGAINPVTQKLTLGSPTANKVLVERKDFTWSDYADESFTATVNSKSGNVLTMSTSAHGIVVGDCVTVGINLGDAAGPVVTAVAGAAVTLSSAATIGTGSVTVYPGIDVQVRWQPVTGGDPSLAKLARQVTFLFKGCDATLARGVFNSESLLTESTVLLDCTPQAAVGDDSVVRMVRVAPLPADAAQGAQLTVGLSVREALTRFKLHGFVANFEADSEKGGRR